MLYISAISLLTKKYQPVITNTIQRPHDHLHEPSCVHLCGLNVGRYHLTESEGQLHQRVKSKFRKNLKLQCTSRGREEVQAAAVRVERVRQWEEQAWPPELDGVR